MKGIILAGGTGSRLRPLTSTTLNKHLLPVGGVPMIYHPIQSLVRAGIQDIMIITGTEHVGSIIATLRSGQDFGCNFTYRVQEKPDGIAGALRLAENFTGFERFAVVLGDNIFCDSFAYDVQYFSDLVNPGCRLFLKQVEHPERFGVVEWQNPSQIRMIVEKPEVPPSAFAVTGLYMYSSKVYDILKNLRPSERGEFEITDVNNAYLAQNDCSFRILDHAWQDAGTHESYRRANQIAYEVIR